MTNEQAIKILSSQLVLTLEPYLDKDGIFVGGTVVAEEDMKTMEAYEVAIEALEKQISIKEVINQLRENKINCKNSSTIYDTKDYVLLDKAIEIVKGDWRVEE